MTKSVREGHENHQQPHAPKPSGDQSQYDWYTDAELDWRTCRQHYCHNKPVWRGEEEHEVPAGAGASM